MTRAEERNLLLLCGITLAATADAVAGTALTLSRSSMMGAVHATSDQYSWLDMVYTAAKLVAFLFAAAIAERWGCYRVLVGALAAALVAALACTMTDAVGFLLFWRMLEGLAGGLMLVSGQTILLAIYPRARQPIVQAVFALGAVMAPTTVAPALEGWIVDALVWSWVFRAAFVIGLIALGLILTAPLRDVHKTRTLRLDWPGVASLSVALTAVVYLLTMGERWNWFVSPESGYALALVLAGLAAFVMRRPHAPMIVLSPFAHRDFAFGFIVSFMAGIALSGSAYLIPAFAASVLGFSPKAAGFLLLPGGALVALGLLGAGLLIASGKLVPFKLVPPGLILLITAIWMLSGSSWDSGAGTMMLPLLLRGLGLGFLFVSLTLITLLGLEDGERLAGVGLFSFGKQMGGLVGVAGLQTFIAHHAALAGAVLTARLTPDSVLLAARLAAIKAALASRGMDPASAARASDSVVEHLVQHQVALLSYTEAFAGLALFFVATAPLILLIKFTLARRMKA
ncbi:MAG: MFS transporter [Alphaproteobacteria bacterium]|nr:MFS transporter [Alphaproteobacteria bacterium]MDE1986439.1 MFS transporter [Alphaproteobacteria bacterium]MDE2163849.1 MFS transporter [Alphaproteobacteria bacterium]MDE2498868.1 MFS transporter [Alphaproteobacteria bacterium]